MIQDLLAIVHCFSSRFYGLRRYKAKLKDVMHDADIEPSDSPEPDA